MDGRGRVGGAAGSLGGLDKSEWILGMGGAPAAGALGGDGPLLIGFNLEIPPAKISPNCGPPPMGIGGAEDTL